MQYIRRRIQRVSGVTVRDERVESRDFSKQARPESSDGPAPRRERDTGLARCAQAFNWQDVGYRQRT
ncbi:MAG: hypothetical protein R3D05_07850 [Dongiaceae bacterium]